MVSRVAELHADIDQLEALVARAEARRMANATDEWLSGSAYHPHAPRCVCARVRCGGGGGGVLCVVVVGGGGGGVDGATGVTLAVC